MQEAQQAVQVSHIALAYLGVGLGLGLTVIGAGLGIGRLANGAAEAVARQPGAAADIRGIVNLPLFLLEGVAILSEVFCLLVLLLTMNKF
jgi:F-type H+-transporting ATPase subunit c